jgi:hypothetical protein
VGRFDKLGFVHIIVDKVMDRAISNRSAEMADWGKAAKSLLVMVAVRVFPGKSGPSGQTVGNNGPFSLG